MKINKHRNIKISEKCSFNYTCKTYFITMKLSFIAFTVYSILISYSSIT